MKKSKEKVTQFFVTENKDTKGIEVEFDKSQKCELCDTEGSYWVGGNDSICSACIRGLAELKLN